MGSKDFGTSDSRLVDAMANVVVTSEYVPPAKGLVDGAKTRREALKQAGVLLAAGGLAGVLAACQTGSSPSNTSTGTGTSGGLLGRGIAGGKIYYITFLSTLNYFDGV